MFEAGKEYKTQNGRRVRIYATDGGGGYPIHGAILQGNVWEVETWKSNGIYYESSGGSADLMPPKRGWWINVYAKDGGCWGYVTREAADYAAGDNRVACVYVEEGDGL